MDSRIRKFAVLAAGAVLAITSVAHAQTSFTITDLGALPGTSGCAASAVDEQGTVVGECGGALGESAFVWSAGVMRDLGKLPRGNYSLAHAINGRGVIVGEGDTGDFRPHPTLYRNGKWLDIDATGGNARAIFVSDGGAIVGDFTKGLSGNAASWSAVIWTERPAQPGRFDRVSLPPYPGGDAKVRMGYATGANNAVQVVGWVQSSLFGQMGAFWNNDASHTLSLLPPFPGDWTSIAWGVNEMGQAVGESHPPFHTRAVLWLDDAAHTPVDLGALAGDSDSSATAINAQGQVIGTSVSPSGVGRPFLWQTGQMTELGSLLDASGAGWTIQSATAINSLGQIVGTGLYQGQSRAFLMTPAAR
jgi:probable HAF family extracellular repeat protein